MNNIKWLKENRQFLSLTAIEVYLEMPPTTIVKAVNGSQDMSKKWEEPLNEFLNELINGVEV